MTEIYGSSPSLGVPIPDSPEDGEVLWESVGGPVDNDLVESYLNKVWSDTDSPNQRIRV